MSQEKRLASFCRLCLIRTQNRVQLFGQEDEVNLMSLLKVIELDIDPKAEPDAVVCYDCIVTLEGFQQFKEQCHTNDEYLKTLPPKDSAEGSEVSEVDELEIIDGDYLLEEEEELEPQIENSEEEGRVEEDDDSWYEEPPPKRKASMESFKVKRLKTTNYGRPESPADPLDVKQSGRVRKPTPKVQASTKTAVQKIIEKPKRKKLEPIELPEPAPEDLPPLKDSYPDYFHFEKGPRSLYYTLVFYGERFNSAIYSPNQTYWQCAYKRKFQCPAVVTVSNDYVDFERRYKHSHAEQRESGEFELFTPRQALPEVFRIAWQKLTEKKLRRDGAAAAVSAEATLEDGGKERRRKRGRNRKQRQLEQEPEEVESVEEYGEEEPVLEASEMNESGDEEEEEEEEDNYQEDSDED